MPLEESIYPETLQRTGPGEIQIVWSDQVTTRYRAARLRDVCPCATCREKRRAAEQELDKPRGLPVLSPAETQPLEIVAMRPIGNYAYNIAFSDGHDSGIFVFEFLRSDEVRSSR